MEEKQTEDGNALIPAMGGDEAIRSRIFTVRGRQVMLAPDLADLYQVPTSAFNQAVKRNIERFPEGFRFQLTKKELEEVITICDNPDRLRFSPRTPFAFTEQGVAMLSGILNSAVAVQASIRIMNAFVAMRHALLSMAPMLARIESAERRQITDQARNEKRFDTIFKAMAGGEFPPQKIFFEGEVFDADAFISKHILSATKSILLIDNWVDIGTLEKLSRKASGVTLEIVTSKKGNKIKTTDIASFTKQYGGLTIRETKAFHDRFLIIDGAKLYHVGASLKDLGNKCFAITTLDATLIPDILAHL
jgi:hypothetical protein